MSSTTSGSSFMSAQEGLSSIRSSPGPSDDAFATDKGSKPAATGGMRAMPARPPSERSEGSFGSVRSFTAAPSGVSSGSNAATASKLGDTSQEWPSSQGPHTHPKARPSVDARERNGSAEANVVRIRDLTTGHEFEFMSEGDARSPSPQPEPHRFAASKSPLRKVSSQAQGKDSSQGQGQVRDLRTGTVMAADDFHRTISQGRKTGAAAGDHAVRNSVEGKRTGWKAFLQMITGKRSAHALEGPGMHNHGANAPKTREMALGSVRVAAHKKGFRELSDLRCIQAVLAHDGSVWSAKFSPDGKYLATAGQDGVVRIWSTLDRGPGALSKLDSTLKRSLHQATGQVSVLGDAVEKSGDSVLGANRTVEVDSSSPPLLAPKPHRVWTGHRQDVLDLAWSPGSKAQFVLSASMDKTVRLWHISMNECLRVFRHNDFVTCVDFFPRDDKVFISGSFDGKVRMWNIPEQRVLDWADLHDAVTAASYSPDGKQVVVGSISGQVRFYNAESSRLLYSGQLDAVPKRTSRGSARKVTGLEVLDVGDQSHRIMITSNDSRIRLFDKSFQQIIKYKGHRNVSSQIRASTYIDTTRSNNLMLCASDDGLVYMWRVSANTMGVPSALSLTDAKKHVRREKNSSYECFRAFQDTALVAIFAPDSLRQRPISGTSMSFWEHGLIVAAGSNGQIRIFENVAPPEEL